LWSDKSNRHRGRGREQHESLGARKRRLRFVDSALLLTETATNSKPVSAPATPAMARPKFTQSEAL
jgi:hypothetical protein